MAYLMGEGDVGDLGWDVGGIILNGDDACVQGLPLPIGIWFVLLTNAT